MKRSKLLNPVSMLCVGLLLGIVSRLFDIYCPLLGEIFSQMSVWILLGTLIAGYSPTKKAAIENNKTEEISLSDLARSSLFSPWYSYRLFRDCLGLTPTEYIRKYRLTEAAKQLCSGDVKVIDAAMDAGFTNVDTFTRAFYREFGLNPSDS